MSVNTREGSVSEALLDWEGGANIVIATAPSAAPGEIALSPVALIGGRRRLMGSRKDIRDTLAFAANNGVRSLVTTRSLKEVGNVLDEMHEGRLRNRVVLTME